MNSEFPALNFERMPEWLADRIGGRFYWDAKWFFRKPENRRRFEAWMREREAEEE